MGRIEQPINKESENRLKMRVVWGGGRTPPWKPGLLGARQAPAEVNTTLSMQPYSFLVTEIAGKNKTGVGGGLGVIQLVLRQMHRCQGGQQRRDTWIRRHR